MSHTTKTPDTTTGGSRAGIVRPTSALAALVFALFTLRCTWSLRDHHVPLFAGLFFVGCAAELTLRMAGGLRVGWDDVRYAAQSLLPGHHGRTARTVRAARTAYFTAAARAADLFDKLDTSTGLHARARALGDLAAVHEQMAHAYRTVWHTTSQDQQITDGYTAASDLLHLLASTEIAESAVFRAHGNPLWEGAFGPLLDALSEQTDLAERAALTTRLYLAAHPVIGEDAAETLARVRTAYIRAHLAKTARINAARKAATR